MNKYEIIAKIEAFAPLDLQEKWDMSGWIVDNHLSEVNKVLFALTVTDDVYNQALSLGCDMIIAHHPLFCVPLEFKDINIYSAHTNFDKTIGGTTDILIRELGLKGEVYNDFVRVVTLEQEMTVQEFIEKLKIVSPNLRYINRKNIESIKKIAFCAGSGSEFISQTYADAFVTGDLKFHTALDSDKIVFDIGHFESEILSVKYLKEISGVGSKGIIANEKNPFMY